MKENDVRLLIEAAQKWAIRSGKNEDIYKEILDFKPTKFNGKFYAKPRSFYEVPGNYHRECIDEVTWLKRQIDTLKERLQEQGFEYRNQVYLAHYDKFIFLILGEDEVQRYKGVRHRINKVNLSFVGYEKSDDAAPSFVFNSDVNLSVCSQEEGWLYLFHIDATGIRSLIYPFEGKKSEIELKVNSKEKNLSGRINRLRATKIGLEPLKFRSTQTGMERLVALVLKTDVPLPIAVSHLLHIIPYEMLFSHEVRMRGGMGGGFVSSDNDVTSLSLDKIAIGTLDYFNEGITALS